MRILQGTEKQVAWATDIRRVAIELLEAKNDIKNKFFKKVAVFMSILK